jgi:hypothetical protein
MALNAGGDPFDWFFLAAVRRQQGDPARARAWYDRAVAGATREGARARQAELTEIQAEVARALGVPGGLKFRQRPGAPPAG